MWHIIGAVAAGFFILGVGSVKLMEEDPLAAAARVAVKEYVAEATSLQAERVRALYVVEQVDAVLERVDPDATATYATFSECCEDDLIHDLAGKYKAELMGSALKGGITPEDDTFGVADTLRVMRAAALAELKE